MDERAFPKLVRVIGYASVHRSLFPSIKNSILSGSVTFDLKSHSGIIDPGSAIGWGEFASPVSVSKKGADSNLPVNVISWVRCLVTLLCLLYHINIYIPQIKCEKSSQFKLKLEMIVKMSFSEIKASVSERPSD